MIKTRVPLWKKSYERISTLPMQFMFNSRTFTKIKNQFGAMEDIKDISIEEDVKSKFLRIKRMHYTQNGRKKAWDIAETHDCLAILQYNRTTKNFTLVKQFRPPVYLKNQQNETLRHLGGVTHELCAGLIDKENKNDLEICHEEILEECGYNVPLDKIEKITSVISF
jgi:UDP-sugar diphosphatase